jgi:RHS repeat-associated protein
VFIAAISLTRGFTGHEHLDQVGLIHMGGRVYDPEIGRFLSPDPFVQFPASTQGFNRYAYVGNNPLSYTDPSGYFLKKLMKVAGIGMNFIPGWTLMGNAFIHGFVSGFLASEGDVKAGMMGMMSAGIAGEIGKINDLNNFSRSALHGITQGAVSAAGGGRFGDGALGAFSGSLLSFIPEAVAGPYGSGGEWAKIGRMTAAAVVGGTASALGGGKFANGAWSAAFVSRFNHDGGGRMIYPAGGSSDINDYDAVMVHGMKGDLEDFTSKVNEEGIPGYYYSSGGLMSELLEVVFQKFHGSISDPVAAGLSRALAGRQAPITVFAHSRGALAAVNAARYYGLPTGSTLVLQAPPMARHTANLAALANRGTVVYQQRWGDVANLYSPSLNPLKWASGVVDPLCGFCVHGSYAPR